MKFAQAKKELGVSSAELYRLGQSGVIRTKPAQNGSRQLDYNDEDVYAYKKFKTGPWTVPYLRLPSAMPEEQAKQILDRMMFFCYSKKYDPILPAAVDLVSPDTPFSKHHQLKAVLRRAADKKLERLVVADPDLLKGDSFLYETFFGLLQQLGLQEIVVADLNLS